MGRNREDLGAESEPSLVVLELVPQPETGMEGRGCDLIRRPVRCTARGSEKGAQIWAVLG